MSGARGAALESVLSLARLPPNWLVLSHPALPEGVEVVKERDW